MSREISRVVVAAVGVPVVLGLVWLGGWWIVALAAVAGVIAIHELCSFAYARSWLDHMSV